ncbi:MAG: nickel-dependent hydrogenase large subunit, partial [Cyanobacteria bacterium J06555_13]
QPDSYLKSPYYKPLGYPDQTQLCRIKSGLYRVGPLARLNICDRIGTPLAEQELQTFRQHGAANKTVNSSFFYHYARLIEILTCIERIEIGLDEADLHSDQLHARADVNRLEAIGVSEAPRGTLFHHYSIDHTGLLTRVNMIIATGQNNLAMNRTVTQIARHYIHGSGQNASQNAGQTTEIPEPMLNRVEAGIRAFDPCLSCSTHAAGQMPLQLQLMNAAGQVIHQRYR